VWVGTPDAPRILVAYAWLNEGQLRYMTIDNDPYQSTDEMVAEAFDNLATSHAGFELIEADGGRMLLSAGLSFSSEQVLCRPHMKIAHDKLDTDEILVSIPRRGLMFACAADAEDSVKKSMAKLHQESVAESATDPSRITNEIIVMEDGIKSGSLDIRDLLAVASKDVCR